MWKRETAISRQVLAVALVAMVLVLAGVIYVAGEGPFFRPSPSTVPTTGPTGASSTSRTTAANSTFTPYCPQNATCDYTFALTINITCTGCSFIGNYSGSYQPSGPTQVSGTGNTSFSVNYFDSPISLIWSISKNSSAGTLEVKITAGEIIYDKTATAPFGNLSGSWNVAVA